MSQVGKGAPESIAIIGMAARVPGAQNIDQLWRNLVDGRESISAFDRADQLAKGVPATVVDDPAFVPAAPVLEDAEYFDADYFGMTPREAEITDPQHRLFLELAHTALEDAGYDPARSDVSIGVYGGCGPDTYRWRNVERSSALLDATNWLAVTVGNYPDYFATRVSYRLNLRGPSYGLQTACSTSLVAIHVAAEALLRDECDMALAGGVCIELPHGVGYVYDGGVTSRDGHCRPFDAAASGTVWSSGGGIVLLKRLSRALADGDHVRAVVLGSAINNDGAMKSGMTAPSAEGQADAARRALDRAGVDPRSVSYVEAHGTGTQLGDPVELAGLSSAYGASGRTRWCALGSIKSNVGHLSQAAGVVGVIKTVLSLENQQIPPTVNFVEPNPALRLTESPFRIASELSAWETEEDMPRRAGVSSFGIGGTNAHVVLQEAPPNQRLTPDTSSVQLLQVSAKTPEALDQLLGSLDAFLATAIDLDLADIAYTLRVGRSVHRHRAVAVVDAGAERQVAGSAVWRRGVAPKQPRSAVFLFSGQGAQYPGMAALYDHEPAFATAVDECLDSLDGELRDTLRTLLLTMTPSATSTIDQTRYTQPALFIVEYAVARLWQSWGVEPAAMIGHSVGEYVAATLAGVFSLVDALRLVVLRGELMQSTQPGSMLSVTVDTSDLVGLEVPGELSLACVNAPGAVIISGPSDTVEDYARTLHRQGVAAKPLRTSHAFHSATMDPILDAFRAEVASVERRAPTRRYLSNLTGTWQTAEGAQDPDYWVAHLRGTVRFADNVSTVLEEDSSAAFIECGPGQQLTSLVLAQAPEVPAVASVPGPITDADPAHTIMLAAGTLWTAGLATTDTFGAVGNRVPLPTYPYQRRKHWATPDPTPESLAAATPAATQPAVQPVDRWFHTEIWRHDRLPGESRPPRRTVLFTADEHGHRVAAELRERGVPVVEVWPGDRFRRDRDDRFEINPAATDDYEHLVRDIGPADLTHIVHAWSVAAASAGDDPDTVMAVQERGFYSVLHLVQALTSAGAVEPVHLDIVTRGAQEVLGGDLTCPEQATLSGIAKVLPLEAQLFSVRHVDVDSTTASTDGALVTEILRRPTGRAETVALRNGRRWLPEYVPLSLTEHADSAIRDRGVYLITGGLGAIGLTVAEDLAQRAKARLVLTSRVGLPERRTWGRYLAARGNTDRTGRAIEAIQRMEDAGAEVLVLAADATEPEDLTYLRDTITDEYGRLDGIIHAAGVPSGTMLELQDRQASEHVLAPKLRGTPALYRALADLEPRFLLLCSSITAAFGRLGHADYCAANSYLDAFARAHSDGPTRVLSVGWDAWLSIGMAVDQSEPDHVRSARQSARRTQLPGMLLDDEQEIGIAPDDGVAAMHAVLAAGLSGHVLTSVLPVAAARAGWQVDVASLTEPALPTATPRAQAAPQPADQPAGNLEETLAHIWADTLGHPIVGLDQDFVELGGDSLTAIRLLARIRETTGVTLSRRSLFEASTVQQLAATIDGMRERGEGGAEPAPAEDRPVIARLSRS